MKCFRISKNQVEKTNTYAEWLQAKERTYLKVYINNVILGHEPGDFIFNAPCTRRLITNHWRFSLDTVARAHYLESTLQLVERTNSIIQRHIDTLIPIRFNSANRITKENRLLLAFDAFVFSQAIGRKIVFGRIIHGENYSRLKIKVEALYTQVQKDLAAIRELLSADLPPEVVLKKHCIECEFQIVCNADAIAREDLSLLSGMSEKERKKLNSKGILTISNLSYTFRPRRKPKRLSGKQEKYHHSLKALAIQQGKIHVTGSEELKILGTPVYIDVEGLPDRDFYYLIGIRFSTGQEIIQHSLWADSRADEKEIWANFICVLSNIPNPILVHFGSYEKIFLKKMCARYGEPSSEKPASKAIKNPVNLLGFIYSRVYFPTYTNGLKDIATFLGFSWTDSGAKGIHAIMWRNDWEQSSAFELKQKIVTYNAEDCEALEHLTVFLSKISAQNHKPTANLDLVTTDSLIDERLIKYCRTDFQVKALEEINRTAYWDYQHEKIQVRSSKHLSRLAKLANNRTSPKLNVNKVIHWPPPVMCPSCGCTKLYRYRKFTKDLIDVRFGKNAIKKCVTRFMFYRYICTSCRTTFCSTDPSWSSVKYGLNLMVLAVYLNIDMMVKQTKIADLINELLGLTLSRNVISRFKAKAAALYRTTYDKILNKIISGTVIHADETQISLNGKRGYVWTFVNAEYVSYIYATSRESDLLKSVLANFKGVLVSDFYAAYESLNCPQQKCLIHLIRDMNDDLIKEPFNEEIKLITNDFAELLRNIVQTIDRFGLKARYLRKHNADVNRFFKNLSTMGYKSETAVYWKKRFEKNRQGLFTFLNYDNVPWNNNNAEHSIKAVALLRRDLAGASNEQGMKDYLTLLSVRETCKFKGISFLEFLRSGEKDIDIFVHNKISRKLPTPGLSE